MHGAATRAATPVPARRRIWRWIALALAVVVLAPLAAGAALIASFDTDAWKPRIEAAVKRATGRDLALNGPLHLGISFAPTIRAENVALSNPPGFSRPQMATLQALRVRVALLPLLSRRVVIEGLTLLGPDILLERDAAGRGNWVLRPQARPASASQPEAASAPDRRTSIAVRRLRIEDGTLTWRERSGHEIALDVRRLDLSEPSDTAPLRVTGQVVAAGLPVSIDGQTGPVPQLLAPSAPAAPWPVALTLSAPDGQMTADGSIAQPAELRGYAGTLTASVPDLSSFQPLVPDVPLPPLRALDASARIADAGQGTPQLSSLTLKAGASDLSVVAPGLQLAALTVSAPALGDPVQIDLQGSLDGHAVKLAGSAAPLSALLPGNKGKMSIDIAGQAADSTATLKGTIASAASLSGKDLMLDAHVANLTVLSALAGRPLPPLRDVALKARIGDAPGGVALNDMSLILPQGDLAGTVALGVANGRPVLRAVLTSQRLDADSLLGAMQALRAPPPAAAAQPQAAPAPPAQPPPPARAFLIPDTKLPFAALRDADADAQATLADLWAGGAEWREVKAHLVLKDGRLSLDPVSMQAPGGAVTGKLSADATQASPPVALTIHAPALALHALLAALGLPPVASGNLQLDADLRGAGDTPHALASTLDGHLGAALVDGEISNRLVAIVLGEALRSADIPVDPGAGRTPLRCLALRADATHGVATLDRFALDTSKLQVQGEGRIDLGTEALDLQLRPLLRLGGTGVAVPVHLGGTLLAPTAQLAHMGAEGRVGAIIGALAGAGAGVADDACAPALVAARGGQPGPAPAQPAPRVKGPSLRDLRKLFR